MNSRVQQISGEDHVSCCRSKLTGQQQIVLSCLWLHESDSKCLVVKIHSSIFGVVDYCRPYCHFAIHPWTFQSCFKTFLFLISDSMWSRNRIGRTTGNEANDLLSQAMQLLFCGTVVVYTPKQQQSYIYCVWIFKCCLLLVFCLLKDLAASETTMDIKYRLLAKTFVYGSLLHSLICKANYMCWQTCWQRSFRVWSTTFQLEIAMNRHCE